MPPGTCVAIRWSRGRPAWVSTHTGGSRAGGAAPGGGGAEGGGQRGSALPPGPCSELPPDPAPRIDKPGSRPQASARHCILRLAFSHSTHPAGTLLWAPRGSCHLPLGPLFPLPETLAGWAQRSHCVFAPARVQGRPSWASALCPGRRAHFTLSPLHPRPVLGRPSFAQPLSLPQRRRSRGSQRGKRCRQPGAAEAVGQIH